MRNAHLKVASYCIEMTSNRQKARLGRTPLPEQWSRTWPMHTPTGNANRSTEDTRGLCTRSILLLPHARFPRPLKFVPCSTNNDLPASCVFSRSVFTFFYIATALIIYKHGYATVHRALSQTLEKDRTAVWENCANNLLCIYLLLQKKRFDSEANLFNLPGTIVLFWRSTIGFILFKQNPDFWGW